jgi:hypothetical protein
VPLSGLYNVFCKGSVNLDAASQLYASFHKQEECKQKMSLIEKVIAQ